MRKDQRHYIYKKAHRNFINNLKLGHKPLDERRGTPLCHLLSACTLSTRDVLKLKEFWSFSPLENISVSKGQYWTADLTTNESRAVRETILLFCIEMSK